MKNYLLFDDYSDYVDTSSYEDLKRLLIDDIEEDTFNNFEENVVKSNFKLMKKLTEEKYNADFIIQELKGFGWNIIDLNEIEEDLRKLLFFRNYKNNECIEQTLKLIEDLKYNRREEK